MTRSWHPISHYSNGQLRRMANDSRDLRSQAAARELARRADAEPSPATSGATIDSLLDADVDGGVR